MSRHPRRRRHYDDTQLNHIIDTTMDDLLARLDANFDHAAGLADSYARAGASRPAPKPDWASIGHDSSALAAACDQIDQLATRLAGIISSGRRAPIGGSAFLELAHDNLIQLRTGQLRSIKIGKLRRITSQHLGEFISSLEDADQKHAAH